MIRNGAYQVFVAYVENEVRVTDYIGISNIQTIWSHEGSNGSLNISLSNLDKDYEYYEVVLLRRNQGQTSAKRIGFYSVQQSDINIDYIDESLPAVSLETIPLRSPAYEKSESMFVVNDWLIRQGPTEQFDFNYQPDANNIQVEWVANAENTNFYYKGGNKYNFLRDEQYAFFIRWIYNTGERSSSYHIPGRAPESYTTPSGSVYQEDEIIYGDNVLDTVSGDKLFKVYNTASVTSLVTEELDDGTVVYARGKMGYWESTERYPMKPDIWGDLCGKPIRHHKMPSEETSNALALTNTTGDLINILGVQFSNIARPKYNDGTFIPNVVGYEILRGSRLGAKSILAKGLFRNMRKYTVPNPEDLIGNNVQGLYVNYPYNDLRPDIYFHTGGSGSLKRTDGCDSFDGSMTSYQALGDEPDIGGEPAGYSRKVFSFSSPDLMFTKPFLNAYETRIYGQLSGSATGRFKQSEDHPQFKLLRGGAALVASIIGFGYAIHQLRGTEGRRMNSTGGNMTSISGKGEEIVGTEQRGNNGFVTLTVPPGVATVNWSPRSGGRISGGDWEIQDPTKLTTYKAAATAAVGASSGSSLALSLLMESLAGIGDLYTGGLVTEIQEGAQITQNATHANVLGVNSGIQTNTRTKDTSTSNIPQIFRTITGLLSTQTNLAIGGNEIIELLYNLADESSFAYKYNSEGFFFDFSNQTNGLWRIKNTDSNYIGQSFQTFNQGEI